MSAVSLARRIADLNDQVRARAGLLVSVDRHLAKGMVVLTRGVIELAFKYQVEILARVRDFDAFTPDNDPWGEHDFGAFDVAGVGRVFWKIDTFADQSCRAASEEPADPSQSFRVLTIMLAEEY